MSVPFNLQKTLTVAGFLLLLVTLRTGGSNADGPGGGCTQGCHRDAYWKKDGECIRAESTTCCTDAWAVATGGSRQDLEDDVKHWIDDVDCTEICTGKSDSVAYPWSPINPPLGLFGTFKECICVTNP